MKFESGHRGLSKRSILSNDYNAVSCPSLSWTLNRFTHVDRMLCVSVFSSTIRISRKGWHMLLNFCFHTALTFAVFAGGINRIKHPIICQAVSLSSALVFQCIKSIILYNSVCACACFSDFLMHTVCALNENAV